MIERLPASDNALPAPSAPSCPGPRKDPSGSASAPSNGVPRPSDSREKTPREARLLPVTAFPDPRIQALPIRTPGTSRTREPAHWLRVEAGRIARSWPGPGPRSGAWAMPPVPGRPTVRSPAARPPGGDATGPRGRVCPWWREKEAGNDRASGPRPTARPESTTEAPTDWRPERTRSRARPEGPRYPRAPARE
jgi:hypothetical protein